MRVITAGASDDDPNRQVVLPRELEVSPVVRRHGHDRAGAVLGENEVADPDGHVLAGERVDRGLPGIEAFLAAETRFLVLRAEGLHFSLERRGILRHRGERLDERMLGRQDDERRAVDRVDPGCEYFDLEIW
jgi:hypothetical protein